MCVKKDMQSNLATILERTYCLGRPVLHDISYSTNRCGAKERADTKTRVYITQI